MIDPGEDLGGAVVGVVVESTLTPTLPMTRHSIMLSSSFVFVVSTLSSGSVSIVEFFDETSNSGGERGET